MKFRSCSSGGLRRTWSNISIGPAISGRKPSRREAATPSKPDGPHSHGWKQAKDFRGGVQTPQTFYPGRWRSVSDPCNRSPFLAGVVYLFVTRKEIRQRETGDGNSPAFPHAEMIETDRLTDGQAATALLANRRLDLDAPL